MQNYIHELNMACQKVYDGTCMKIIANITGIVAMWMAIYQTQYCCPCYIKIINEI